jgi:hypothetical protein
MRLTRALSLPLILGLTLCFSAWHSSLNAQTTSEALHLTFTTIDVPGAGYTGVFRINTAGDMVGNYGANTNLDSHGFLYSNGVFTYFDYPGETWSVPTGINDSGLIVGYAGQEPVIGFVYDGTAFTAVKRGSDSATFVDGINNAGELVGAMSLCAKRDRPIQPSIQNGNAAEATNVTLPPGHGVELLSNPAADERRDCGSGYKIDQLVRHFLQAARRWMPQGSAKTVSACRHTKPSSVDLLRRQTSGDTAQSGTPQSAWISSGPASRPTNGAPRS